MLQLQIHIIKIKLFFSFYFLFDVVFSPQLLRRLWYPTRLQESESLTSQIKTMEFHDDE